MKSTIRFLCALLLLLLMASSVLAETSFGEHMAEVIANLNAGDEPGYAYFLTKGDWTVGYTASGEQAWTRKTETNSNYFKTGIKDAYSEVTRYPKNENGEKTWYVAQIAEYYPSGDIAAMKVSYGLDGKVQCFWLSYRTGEDETYTIRYTLDRQPVAGYYDYQIDDGFIHAEAINQTEWRDTATGLIVNQETMGMELVPLSDWTNPPV